MDRVITELESIHTELESIHEDLQKIQQNQYVLYQAIRGVQQQNQQLIQATKDIANQIQNMDSHIEQNIRIADENAKLTQAQLEKLQESSAVAAYAQQQSQKELHYMNRMNYLTGKNDGVWDNLPPQ